jgi:hypothetical protein
MHPAYFQVRTETGRLHVFERHSILRVEIEGWPDYLERRDVPNSSLLDLTGVNPANVRIVVAMLAAGYVELEGQAVVDFLRLFYSHAWGIPHEEPQ